MPGSCSSWLNTLDGAIKKSALLAMPHTSGEAESSLTFLFSPWEKSWNQKVSLGNGVCCLRIQIFQGKSTCSYYPIQGIQTHIFSSNAVLNFSAGTWTSTKALRFTDDCLRQCSPGAHGLRLELVHGPSQGPRPGLTSACLFPNTKGEASQPPGTWCWIPQLPQRHICPATDIKLLLRGNMMRTSY